MPKESVVKNRLKKVVKLIKKPKLQVRRLVKKNLRHHVVVDAVIKFKKLNIKEEK